MKRIRLWVEILSISWHQSPGLTFAVFVLESGLVAANIGVALAIRSTLDHLAEDDDIAAAVLSVVIVALATTALIVLDRLHGLIGLFMIVERTSIEFERNLLQEIAHIEKIEHLERSDYLDQIALLRRAPKHLVSGTWNAVRVGFTVVQLAVTIVLLGRVHPSLIALLLLAVVPLVCDRVGRKIDYRAEVQTVERQRLQQRLFEIATRAQGNKEIRTAQSGDRIGELQRANAASAGRVQLGAKIKAASLRALGWLVFVAGFVAMLYVVGDSSSAAGDVVLVITLTISLQLAVQTFVNQLTNVLGSQFFFEPLLWVRSYIAEEHNRMEVTHPVPDRLKSGIQLHDVSFTYSNSGRPALRNVSVDLPAGSVVALVGEFGSGKSTIVKLLARFYDPDQGRISIDGVDLRNLDAGRWRSRLSGVFQDFGRYGHMSFDESVGIGHLPDIDNAEVRARALAAADGATLAARLPEGGATRLSPRFGGVDLSEGQWQKTALARASMRSRPLLVVLDEPTASLDALSEHAIFSLYLSRARALAERNGTITLVVSHRLAMATDADLVLVLEGGKLVEQGTHEDLLRHGATYRDAYMAQANAYRG